MGFQKKDLSKYLSQLDEDGLREEIKKLYTKFDGVKHFYKMELGTQEDRQAVVDLYKDKVRKQYFVGKGRARRPKKSIVNSIIKNFERIMVFPHEWVDLKLYHAECIMLHAKKYRYVKDSIHKDIATAFEAALQGIEENRLYDLFRERCQYMVRDCTTHLPWRMREAIYKQYERSYEAAVEV